MRSAQRGVGGWDQDRAGAAEGAAMNYRQHHLRRMATTAWARADMARDAAHECEVMALLERRNKNAAKHEKLERMRMRWKRDEARLLAFGRACHAEACRLAQGGAE